jgi:hypothetical protein
MVISVIAVSDVSRELILKTKSVKVEGIAVKLTVAVAVDNTLDDTSS